MSASECRPSKVIAELVAIARTAYLVVEIAKFATVAT